jgi:hypothetical protein
MPFDFIPKMNFLHASKSEIQEQMFILLFLCAFALHIDAWKKQSNARKEVILIYLDII